MCVLIPTFDPTVVSIVVVLVAVAVARIMRRCIDDTELLETYVVDQNILELSFRLESEEVESVNLSSPPDRI